MIYKKKSITELARELRKNPTPKEKLLWEQLRKRRLSGYRFVRQKPFIYKEAKGKKYFFIADFYCPKKKLVLELDGKIHDYQQYYDYNRDLVLEKLGLSTLRLANNDLKNMQKVKQKILTYLK